MLYTECEQLAGRRRTICRGEADLPLNGRNSINAYREAWGLAPLTERNLPTDNPSKPATNIQPKACQGDCPGTELKALLAQLGIKPKSACKCVAKAKLMDQLGAAAIRADKDTWIAYLTEAYNMVDWLTKAAAAIQAFRHGLPKTIEGLLDEALRRAEEKAAQSI